MRIVAIPLVAAMFGCFCAAELAALPVEKAVQVTHGNYSDPSFSPDGKHMVVIATVEAREQLSTMDIDGSHEVRLTSAPFDHEDPAWSPDGRRIAYVSLEGGGQVIHIMNADGSNDFALTPSTQRTIHPSWSKDSTRIIYCTDDDLKPQKEYFGDLRDCGCNQKGDFADLRWHQYVSKLVT
jgi:Tol biopolymer transport system component